MSLAFDALLAAAMLWSAWRALATPDATRAVVMFIVFGLLMTLAWARLDAPDIALAEAAIGAGLTGALLLDALGTLAPDEGKAALPLRRWLPVVLCGLVAAGALVAVLFDLPMAAVDLAHAVDEHLGQSGVSHPVTAVLLNFRGYDTLLEVAVLLLALIALLGLSEARPQPSAAAGPVLQTLARLAAPLMILVAGYLLWAGAHRPGGAFQAGAVLAAAAVLLHLAGLLPPWASPHRLLRFGLCGGLLVFLAVAVLPRFAAPLLTYPPDWAGTLILLVEAALSLSLGLILAGLFLFLSRRRDPS